MSFYSIVHLSIQDDLWPAPRGRLYPTIRRLSSKSWKEIRYMFWSQVLYACIFVYQIMLIASLRVSEGRRENLLGLTGNERHEPQSF
jgi:hypothetical protein